MKVELKGVPIKDCIDQYRLARARLTEKQLCAGGKENKDSCRGTLFCITLCIAFCLIPNNNAN